MSPRVKCTGGKGSFKTSHILCDDKKLNLRFQLNSKRMFWWPTVCESYSEMSQSDSDSSQIF